MAAAMGLLGQVFADGAVTAQEAGLLAGAFAAAAVTVGYATFKVPNKTT